MATTLPKMTAPPFPAEKPKRTPAQWGIIAAGVMFVIGITYVGTRIASDLASITRACGPSCCSASR
jgi:hypothetical protein